ncbi:ABC-three component system middle component 6 [Isoptericola sediminis]|uniref:ABC-three component system middle component 6 n=1 Tax=Isoptericola sediminis TaxID=2733572 RepID=UPI003CCCCBBC
MPLSRTLVGASAKILEILGDQQLTIGQLYLAARESDKTTSYDELVACLAFLYGAGIIDYTNATVRRTDAG